MAKKPTKRATREALSKVDGKALKRHVRRSVFPIADAWTPGMIQLLDNNADAMRRDIVARPEVYGFKGLKCVGGICRISDADFASLVRHAVHAGFGVAMRLHRHELLTTADAAVIVGGQRRGHETGHQSQSRAKERRATEIRDTWARLEAEGGKCTYDAVAALVGCSRSTVERAINNRVTKPAKK